MKQWQAVATAAKKMTKGVLAGCLCMAAGWTLAAQVDADAAKHRPLQAVTAVPAITAVTAATTFKLASTSPPSPSSPSLLKVSAISVAAQKPADLVPAPAAAFGEASLPPPFLPGQSATQLADGRWLLLGGRQSSNNQGDSAGSDVSHASHEQGHFSATALSSDAILVDLKTGRTQRLNARLAEARVAHSATLLPDGSVLILGGRNSAGHFVALVERYDPASGNLTAAGSLGDLGLLPRSGHTANVLADGRLLITGGENIDGTVCLQAELYNPATRHSDNLYAQLHTGRVGGDSALLPDAGVLIWGGRDASGQTLAGAEHYDPAQQRFTPLDPATADAWRQMFDTPPPSVPAIVGSYPVAEATQAPIDRSMAILFDRRMDVSTLNVGNITLFGPHGMADSQVVAVENGQLLFVTPKQDLLPAARYTLFLSGAADSAGQKLPFTALGFTTMALGENGTASANPVEGAGDRRNSGDAGHSLASPANENSPAAGDVVEGFSTQTHSTVPSSVFAAADTSSDKTGANASDAADKNAAKDTDQDTGLDTADDDATDPTDADEEWQPEARNYRGDWLSERTGLAKKNKPKRAALERAYRRTELARDGRIPLETLEAELDLIAPDPAKNKGGNTALAGQTLKLNGKPLSGVTIRVHPLSAGGSLSTPNAPATTTDKNGEFQLDNLSSGFVMLEIDGRSATKSKKAYGRYFYQVYIGAGEVNALPQPIWLVRLDRKHAVKIPSPTTHEIVVTHPQLPGMEVRIPAGTLIRDADGKIVTEISLTPVPVDQTPVQMAYGGIPVYYTLQPGGARIESVSGQPQGVSIVYPNYSTQPPGASFQLFDHDPSGRGWYIYGQVKVSADGKRIEGDKPFVVYQFQSSSAVVYPGSSGDNPPGDDPDCHPGSTDPKCKADVQDGETPEEDPKGEESQGDPVGCNDECCKLPIGKVDGDPVACASGLFMQNTVDFQINDGLPITLMRAYRDKDPNQRAFGVGGSHNYDLYLYMVNPFGTKVQEIDLVTANGGRIPFKAPAGETGNMMTTTFESKSPGRFYGATLKGNFYQQNFIVTLKDGTTYRFSWYYAKLLSIGDRYGNKIGIYRNDRNQVIQVASTNSNRYINFSYNDPNCYGCVTQTKDHTGRTVSYQYGAYGRMAKVTDVSGGITTYEYDAEGRMVSVKEPGYHAGQIAQAKVKNTYYSITDAARLAGRIKEQVYADGTSKRFTYYFGSNGRIRRTDITDGRGVIRRLEYTTSGLLGRETRALGLPEQQVTTNTWNGVTRRLTRSVDTLGRVTAYEYDAAGNVTKVTYLAGTPQATAVSYTYATPYHQLSSVTGPMGQTASIAYDVGNDPKQITDANGNPITVTYNLGKLSSVSDGLGNTARYDYYGNDLIRITDPLGHSTNLTNDVLGRPITATDPLGNVSTLNYDAFDRPVQSTDALNRATAYNYDGNGNRQRVLDAKNGAHWYAYDAHNRLRAWEDPLGKTEYHDARDANGNLLHKGDRRGQNTWYAYDALNRLTRVVFNDSSSIDYVYDAGDRLIKIIDSQNGTITRTYDDLDRLLSESTAKGTVTYTYYPNGRRKSLAVSGQPIQTYTYDNGGRLTRIDQAAGPSNNNRTQYISLSYDAANRRTQTRLPNGQTENYAYDAAGQLKSITYRHSNGSTAGNLTYTYNAGGQRIKMGGSFARVQLPADQNSSLNAGNQLAQRNGKTLTYDGNGNLTSDGSNTYLWNARDQLTEIRNSGGTVIAKYTYDALGRRLTKTINGTGTGYIYSGFNVVQELIGTNTNNATAANVKANYLMGGIDEIYAQQTGTGATAKALNYLTDALGSVIRLTDEAGNKVADYTYDPYGGTTEEIAAGATINNPYQYTGRENDGNGLYYYRARYYSPELKRFISEDPIGLAGGINTHSYVKGNPVSFIDPWGLSPEEVEQIIEQFHRSVREMTDEGYRIDFYPFNNFDSSRKTCGEQAFYLKGKLEENLPKSTNRNWKFNPKDNFTGLDKPWFVPGHIWLEGSSSDPSDPHITMDPWKNKYILDYTGKH